VRVPLRRRVHTSALSQTGIDHHRVHLPDIFGTGLSAKALAKAELNSKNENGRGRGYAFATNNYIAEANATSAIPHLLSSPIPQRHQSLTADLNDSNRAFCTPPQRDTAVIFGYGPRNEELRGIRHESL
jgi:hypothetical protein